MKIRNLFDAVNLTNLTLHVGFLDAEWAPQASDREAAWELYVEMITRIVLQPLPAEQGDEKTALDSVFALFGITREILRRKGRDCIQFTKVAVVVLNQIVRPFTAKWHQRSLAGAFAYPVQCQEFREELALLQTDLRKYARLLAEVAQVEDLTEVVREENG